MAVQPGELHAISAHEAAHRLLAWPDSRFRPNRLHGASPSMFMLTRMATFGRALTRSATRSIRASSSRLSMWMIEPPETARASAASGL